VTETSAVVSSAAQEDPPVVFPVITHTASQQRVGISGDCVVFRDDRDGHWNIYLIKLSTGETFTVTTNEPAVTTDSLRKVVLSQGVVVWRSERAGQQRRVGLL
jgi:beta propeller repeat protein